MILNSCFIYLRSGISSVVACLAGLPFYRVLLVYFAVSFGNVVVLWTRALKYWMLCYVPDCRSNGTCWQ